MKTIHINIFFNYVATLKNFPAMENVNNKGETFHVYIYMDVNDELNINTKYIFFLVN